MVSGFMRTTRTRTPDVSLTRRRVATSKNAVQSAALLAPLPRMNSSTISRAASSLNCTGGDFMKYALGPMSGPATPRSIASLAARSASITMPAEFGESHTSSFSSMVSGTSPKVWPSSRICAHLRSSSHGT